MRTHQADPSAGATAGRRNSPISNATVTFTM
jgi:hypothetical protein